MDTHDINYMERTLRHIRRVQDYMLYLLKNHAEDLELDEDAQMQLLQNAMKHDLSKWRTVQFKPYCDKYERKLDNPEEFERAWWDHYTAEDHHYQGGGWIGRLEAIETCCDIQAMADEFGEGSCFGYYDTKWRPGFHKWLSSPESVGKGVRQQMDCDHRRLTVTGYMEIIIDLLRPRALEPKPKSLAV